MSRRGRGPLLVDRIDALARAADALEGVAPAPAVEQARATIGTIDRRRALSAEHTLIGLFGATGSGKSSLTNALVGREISRAAVRRPTTAHPIAAVLGDAGSDALLDWLEVEECHTLDGTGCTLEQAAQPTRRALGRRAADTAPGIIVLDLPDMDSVVGQNRATAERMTGMVDVIIWVTDPQKYADDVLHHEFVQPFAGHDAVTLLVLNQIDRVREGERQDVLDSLAALAQRDGLSTAPVLGVSAQTGQGMEELRGRIVEIARGREAIAARQRADVAAAVGRLREAADPSGLPEVVSRPRIDALVEDLSVAARVEPVAEAVGRSYRHRAAARVGWPPLRWLRRLRPDPLARWNIGQERDREGLDRTSLPEPDAGTRARASGGVRAFADAASDGGSDPWRAAVRRAARSEEGRLPDALDQAVAGADLRARRTSWWWPVMDVLQWLALLTWVVGLGWLAVNVGLTAAGVPPLRVPMIEDLWVPIPLPVALIAVGVGAGILLATAGGAIAAVVGASARRRARRQLRARVRAVADDLVVAPVQEVLERGGESARDLALAAGEASRRSV